MKYSTMFGTATHMSEHVGQMLYIVKLRRGETMRSFGCRTIESSLLQL
jgi:hypothetical protein